MATRSDRPSVAVATATAGDQYAVPEAQDPAYAGGFGDLSMHEVATDPDRSLAYISHHVGGFRVVSYGPGGMKEVAAASSTRAATTSGGVEVHEHPDGQKYVLASDRDSGVFLFQYTG